MRRFFARIQQTTLGRHSSGTCQECCVFPGPRTIGSLVLEPGLEHGVEVVEGGLHVRGDGSPLPVLKGGDGMKRGPRQT